MRRVWRFLDVGGWGRRVQVSRLRRGVVMDPDARIAAEAMGKPEVPMEPTGEGIVEAGPTFSSRLLSLVKPGPRSPPQFEDDIIAKGVNMFLGQDSKDAQLGESVALCVDAMFPGTSGSGLPPIVYLGRSLWEFRSAKLQKRAARADDGQGPPPGPGLNPSPVRVM